MVGWGLRVQGGDPSDLQGEDVLSFLQNVIGCLVEVWNTSFLCVCVVNCSDPLPSF